MDILQGRITKLARHISVCCVAKLDNGIRCDACVCVYMRARALVRLCVSVAGVVRPAFKGVSRVLRSQAVRRGWAYATLRRTARAFNPRATRSASVPVVDDAILFLHPNRTRARTYDRQWQTHGYKGEKKKIICPFSPSSIARLYMCLYYILPVCTYTRVVYVFIFYFSIPRARLHKRVTVSLLKIGVFIINYIINLRLILGFKIINSNL